MHRRQLPVPWFNGAPMLAGATRHSSSSSGPSINPNLLQWTEELQNGVWLATAAVTADAGLDPLGATTADLVTFSGVGQSVAQTSTTAAATGSVTAGVLCPASVYARRFVTATFDTGDFTFSAWLWGSPSALTVLLAMDVSGGFIRCQIRRQASNGAFLAWGLKLEAGTTPTGDETNYGMRTT